MKVYRATVVVAIESFYGNLLYDLQQFNTVAAHLEALANQMYVGVQEKVSCVFSEINNYHRDRKSVV